MNFFRLSALIACAGCVVFGALVFSTSTRRSANRGFVVFAAMYAVWQFCVWMGSMAQTAPQAAFWIRMSSFAGLLGPIAYDVLRISIISKGNVRGQIRKQIRLWIPWLLPVWILCGTTFFMRGASLPGGRAVVAEPHYGPGVLVYVLWFLIATVYFVREFARNIRQETGIQRMELQFVMLAFAAQLVTAISVVLAAWALGANELHGLLPASVIVLLGFISYGIATRRILGISTVLRRITAHLLLVVALSVTYFVVLWGSDKVLFFVYPHFEEELAHLSAALAVAFSLTPTYGWMQRLAARLFITRQSVDLEEALQQTNRVLRAVTTVDDLVRSFSTTIQAVFHTDRAVVLLSEDSRFRERVVGQGVTGLEVNNSHPLPESLLQVQAPIVLETMERLRPPPLVIEAGQFLAEHGFSLAVGIYSKNALRGVVLLAPHLSGYVYDAREQRTLQILCNQMSVALENATLYTELQNSKIYNDILLDHLVSGVVAADAEGIITVFNVEAQRITGIPSQTAAGASVGILPALLADAMRHTQAQQRGQLNHEGAIVVDGREVHVRIGTSIFEDLTGTPLGVLLVFNDLSNIRELEQQVRRSDRLASIGTLSAGMAHEIKNPLATIKTFTDLLPERFEEKEFRKSFTSLVGSEVRRIDALVNQLLRFARPAKPNFRRIHLHSTLDTSLRLLEQQFRGKQVTAIRSFDAKDDAMRGDANLLNQALVNFILNGVEAMPEGGELRISTSVDGGPGGKEPDGWIRVAIADTGMGIPHDNLSHIFDPFFTTKAHGTGLGLPVSHGIITDQGGVIDVQSAEGEGTTFFISFPLYSKEAT